MWIKKIKINNFRNYKKEEINLEKNINIFYGEKQFIYITQIQKFILLFNIL